MRCGIILTREEGIEIIQERNSQPSISYEEMEKLFQEFNDQIIRFDNLHLEKELNKILGHFINEDDFYTILFLRK